MISIQSGNYRRKRTIPVPTTYILWPSIKMIDQECPEDNGLEDVNHSNLCDMC